MTRKVETEWQTEIIKHIRSSGGYARKMGPQIARGFPDLLVVANGETRFFEVKLLRLKGLAYLGKGHAQMRAIPLTANQQIEMGKIRQAGGRADLLLILQSEDAHMNDARMGCVSTPLVSKGIQSPVTVYATPKNTGEFMPWGILRKARNLVPLLLKTL